MCGIVGLFLKDRALEPDLGALLTEMLVTMTDRGPDSAGIAIYRRGAAGMVKLVVQSSDPDTEFEALSRRLAEPGAPAARLLRHGSHACVTVAEHEAAALRALVRAAAPGLRVMSEGAGIEIFKEVGLPENVARAFGLAEMGGTHGIGHTRMATESAVTTLGAHPFSTGRDQCLVHNGSLSNHNRLRRRLRREGLSFETENDTEVAAAYLSWRMASGDAPEAAMRAGLEDLDGFYTFVVGTGTGFGVVRDPIACKPAVMAETEGWVAFGSEYRALSGLPGIAAARVWEPGPASVHFWERRADA